MATGAPAGIGRRPPFPFRHLLADCRYTVGMNIVCALFITIINGKHSFYENLVYSMFIGGLAFLVVDVVRLSYLRDGRKLGKPRFLGLVLAAVPTAQFFGNLLGNLVLGRPLPSLAALRTGSANGSLLITLLMVAIATFFFLNRERTMRAEAATADEKARSESIARQAMQAQLQLLQAQIEPHMLFNTLANLQGMIGIDPQRAQEMLDQLIQYLRASLSSSRAGQTTLAQEFALMQAYLGLMQVRMGERLGYTLQLPPELNGALIAPMLLQPLVENAIVHGLEPKLDGGHITVSARQYGATLEVCVADTGLGLGAPSAKAGTHIGVANTRDRLQALFGAHAALVLEPNLPGGALARLTFPLSLS